MTRVTAFSHAKTIIAQPFMVVFVIPFCIVYFSEPVYIDGGHLPVWPNYIGPAIFLGGFVLFIASVRLFILVGNGTLAPWNPTKKLVIRGLYRHMRNPMILGVVTMLLAEALFFFSYPLLCWALFFFLLNHLYFVISEEPGLAKRFGEEYLEYKQNVPRWLPRIKAWRPEEGE